MSKTLLVVDFSYNWYLEFKNATLLNGEKIIIEQTRWKYLHVEASSSGGALCHLKQHVSPDEPWPFSSQKSDRTIKPDFCLIRNFPHDSHTDDFKHQLLGLILGDIPSVNSLDSVFMSMERVYQYTQLLKVKKRLGDKSFDLVPLKYHPNTKIRLNVPSPLDGSKLPFPIVCKVGSAHEGRGKIRAMNPGDFRDVESVLTLTNSYFTTEPLLQIDYEYRIQKIGKHYRGFRRVSGSHWMNNVGDIEFYDMPLEEKHIMWAEETSKMMGGLDVMGLDVIHTKDGKDVVIEINDTAIGLLFNHEKEDAQHIKELVLQRMNEYFCPELIK